MITRKQQQHRQQARLDTFLNQQTSSTSNNDNGDGNEAEQLSLPSGGTTITSVSNWNAPISTSASTSISKHQHYSCTSLGSVSYPSSVDEDEFYPASLTSPSNNSSLNSLNISPRSATAFSPTNDQPSAVKHSRRRRGSVDNATSTNTSRRSSLPKAPPITSSVTSATNTTASRKSKSSRKQQRQPSYSKGTTSTGLEQFLETQKLAERYLREYKSTTTGTILGSTTGTGTVSSRQRRSCTTNNNNNNNGRSRTPPRSPKRSSATPSSHLQQFDLESIATYPDDVESLPSIHTRASTKMTIAAEDTKSVFSQDSCSLRQMHRARAKETSNSNSNNNNNDSFMDGNNSSSSLPFPPPKSNRRRQKQQLNLNGSSSSNLSMDSSSSSLSFTPEAGTANNNTAGASVSTKQQQQQRRRNLPSRSHSERSLATNSSRRIVAAPKQPRASSQPEQQNLNNSSSSSLAFLDQHNNSCPKFESQDEATITSCTIDVANAPTTDAQGNPGIYTGSVNDASKPHGYGRMELQNSSQYHGQWVNGIRSGHGKSTNPRGDLYVGTFWDDQEHGNGTIQFCDGRIIVQGHFENGNLISGTMNYPNGGGQYKGTFLDGKRHGVGSYSFADGSHYDGEFWNDSLQGTGTLQWKNGSKFVGAWKSGLRHGQGVEYRADGTIRQEGIWQEGKAVRGSKA